MSAQIEEKEFVQHIEGVEEQGVDNTHGDRALKVLGDERILLTEEDNVRIRRKTDLHILTVCVWVYFLQIYDKTIFGNGKVLGMVAGTKLKGNQYSQAATMNAIAQLAWQPFSSYLIVKVPPRILMPVLVFAWGVSQCCIAASKNFAGLAASRFFLGLFEAGCLPCFGLLTSQWYRRSEQPLRVAAWNGTNGMGTIMAAVTAYGFAHVHDDKIQSWQLIFILSGAITVITAPFIYWLIDSDISSARFLSPEDRAMGIERLRANQTGTGSYEFKWAQARELALDIKTYVFFGITTLVNVGAAVTVYFGPTLINNFGFDVYISSLLNMPFGFLQIVAVLFGCWAAVRVKNKSGIVIACAIIVCIGLGLLYKQGVQGHWNQPEALAGYYLLSFLFGINPVLISWMVANTGGQTKKALTLGVFMAACAVGNIVGPLLFNDKDKPFYHPGIQAALGMFCAVVAFSGVMVGILYMLNKQRARQRVANGKPAVLNDTSMSRRYEQYGHEGDGLGQNG